MRLRRALALVFLVACRIPDERFGVRDGGGDGGDDVPVDGALQPSNKIYVASDDGLWAISKGSAGNLFNARLEASGSFLSPVVNAAGDELYVLVNGTGVVHYSVRTDGELVPRDMQNLTATRLAIDPATGHLAAVSGNDLLSLVMTDQAGKLMQPDSQSQAPLTLRDVAFVQGGGCLLLLSTGTPSKVNAYRYDGVHANPMSAVQWMGTGGVLEAQPHGARGYVASSLNNKVTVQMFEVDAACMISSNGMTTSANYDDSPTSLVVDATRTHVFALGHQVTPFAIDATTGVVLRVDPSTLPQDQTLFGGGLAIDPAEPERLYATGPGFRDSMTMMPGVVRGAVDTGTGQVTPIGAVYFATPGHDPAAIVLAP